MTEDESAFATELYLREDQARLMQSCGMYFGSHGASHYWLDQIPEQKKRQDITRSLDFLNRIGSPVNDFWVMCYPYGAWDSETLRILEQYNCTFGLTTEVATANISSNNPLTLPRYDTNDFPQ